MKQALYSIILVCITFGETYGQIQFTQWQPNLLRVRMKSNGLFTSGPSGGSIAPMIQAEPPAVMYSGGLWLSGIDEAGGLRVAANLYGAQGHDFFSGPLTNDGTASITTGTNLAYDRFWRVNSGQMAMHQAYFSCLSDPGCDENIEFPNGYTIPDHFLTWPAHGDVFMAQDANIAPFMDFDGDGSYDPAAGDHPCVPGNDAMFLVFNDVFQTHVETGGAPLGVEVQMMPFAYQSADADINSTIFIHYRIINRSNGTLSNFYISNFSDFDLGCPDSDNIGTDVERNMVYVYNGTEVDEPCFGIPSFGEQPPAFGMVILKGPLKDANGMDDAVGTTLPAFNGSGFGDGIVDNERLGLSRSMHFRREGNSAQTDPAVAAHFHNYQRSIWKNSLPLTYGGNGYSEDPSAIPSLFAFPGDSDPYGAGTNGMVQDPWYDELSPSLPDPKAIGTMGPITMAPGAEQEILIAYVYARATEGGAFASVAALQERVDNVRAFAETIPGIMADGPLCDQLTVGISTQSRPDLPLEVFPNPSQTHINVALDQESIGGMLRVMDMRGAVILERRITSTSTVLEIGSLSPGTYVIRCDSDRVLQVGRFVKE